MFSLAGKPYNLDGSSLPDFQDNRVVERPIDYDESLQISSYKLPPIVLNLPHMRDII